MNKKNYMPILILIILVIAFIIIRSNDKTEKRIRFFPVDSVRVAVVEIIAKDDTLRIEKQDDQWMITYPVKYPPETRKITELFSKVLKVETSNIPVSESEASLVTYSLEDSMATLVRISDKQGKILHEALIAKSSNYHYAYGRRVNDNKIYQLYENISHSLNPDVSSWRKKEILEYTQEDLARITVSYEDVSYQLTPTDSLWQYQQDDQVIFVQDSNAALKSILTNASKMRTSTFADGVYEEYKDALENPVLQLNIEYFNGDQYHFRFADYEDGKYLLQKNDQTDYLYVVFEYLLDNFRKTQEDFLK
ncbi:MAG: DUF4340 domain-containing protein [Candidatus Cloacimonetes bacterium]|nr:DUF4340 domain-containing protein [Candidatus Cloacimonadota bacterium]